MFRGRLTVADRDVLRRSPAALVRLFAVADREGLDLYPFARDLAAQAATELPPEAAADPELNQELLALFTRPGTRGRFLPVMHEVGVLQRVIPEFARVTARRQIDLYHVYTVDVHSLFAVRRLLALRNGDVQDEGLTPLMQGSPVRWRSTWARSSTTSARGRARTTRRRGAEIAAAACVRMGIDPADAADVEWLVAKHLRMASHRAAARPLRPRPHPLLRRGGRHDRPARQALPPDLRRHRHGGPEHLDRVEGAAPARAVREDPRRAGAAGERGGGRIPGTARGLRPRRGRRRPSGRGAASAGRERFVAAMPARYFLTEPPGAGAAPPAAPRDGRRTRPLAAVVRHRPALGHSELALTAADRAGLLALVAGVLAAHRIDIQHAEVFSTPNDPALGWIAGRALDLFELRGPEGGAIEPARWRAARADLQGVLVGVGRPRGAA